MSHRPSRQFASTVGLVLFLSALPAQAPVSTRFYASYRLSGDTTSRYDAIIIDPPLTLTRDASGKIHLGISLLAGEGIVTAQGNIAIEDAFIPRYFTGQGVPIRLACVAGRDFYTDLDASKLYTCIRTGMFGWMAVTQ